MAEVSDFKFGIQLEFAKAHHKITPRGESDHGLGLGELPNILGFPYNISATAGASDFKRGKQLEFAKAHDKITRRRRGRHDPGLGVLPKIWGVPFDIYTMAEASDFKFGAQLGFAKRRSVGLGKLPNIWSFPLIFLQRSRCPLSVSGASCFMMCLGKPKLHTKFEAASFSCCKNIKGKLQNFGKLP